MSSSSSTPDDEDKDIHRLFGVERNRSYSEDGSNNSSPLAPLALQNQVYTGEEDGSDDGSNNTSFGGLLTLYSYDSSSEDNDSNNDSNAFFHLAPTVLQSDYFISNDDADDDNDGPPLVITCLSSVGSGKESDADNNDVFVPTRHRRTRHISQPPTCDSLTDDSSNNKIQPSTESTHPILRQNITPDGLLQALP